MGKVTGFMEIGRKMAPRRPVEDRLKDRIVDGDSQGLETDLDEALKIGSRIAIMEGGEIVQVGTPQDIVLSPSSDYVRDFVAHMNPLNVLRAQEIMIPVTALPKTLVEGECRIDEEFTLTKNGRGRHFGQPADFVPLAEIDQARRGVLVTVTRDTPLRAIIDARLKHPGPFVVRENDVNEGLVRDDELFRCLAGARDRQGS